MCEVHLVADVDEERSASAELICGECSGAITAGERYRHVEGALDDGSAERYAYRAHEDCYQLAYLDVGPEGCFTYGGAAPV